MHLQDYPVALKSVTLFENPFVLENFWVLAESDVKMTPASTVKVKSSQPSAVTFIYVYVLYMYTYVSSGP